MATTTYDLNELKRRMHGATQVLKQELGGLRTGRASTGLLDHVQADAYGTHMPLNQLATISVPEPRLLSVQVWLKTMDDFEAMNAVYDAWVVQGNAPTRACGKVDLADPGYRIEVIAIAARP